MSIRPRNKITGAILDKDEWNYIAEFLAGSGVSGANLVWSFGSGSGISVSSAGIELFKVDSSGVSGSGLGTGSGINTFQLFYSEDEDSSFDYDASGSVFTLRDHGVTLAKTSDGLLDTSSMVGSGLNLKVTGSLDVSSADGTKLMSLSSNLLDLSTLDDGFGGTQIKTNAAFSFVDITGSITAGTGTGLWNVNVFAPDDAGHRSLAFGPWFFSDVGKITWDDATREIILGNYVGGVSTSISSYLVLQEGSLKAYTGGSVVMLEVSDNLFDLSSMTGDVILRFPSTTSGQAQLSYNRSTDFFDLETPDGAGGANKIVRIGRQDFGGGIIVDEIEMDSGTNAAGQITFFRDSGTGTKGQIIYNELGSLYGRPNRSFDWFIPELSDPTLTLLDNLLDFSGMTGSGLELKVTGSLDIASADGTIIATIKNDAADFIGSVTGTHGSFSGNVEAASFIGFGGDLTGISAGVGTFSHNQSTASLVWIVAHSLSTTIPTFQVWDDTGSAVEAQEALVVDSNTLKFVFGSTIIGSVRVLG